MHLFMCQKSIPKASHFNSLGVGQKKICTIKGMAGAKVISQSLSPLLCINEEREIRKKEFKIGSSLESSERESKIIMPAPQINERENLINAHNNQ